MMVSRITPAPSATGLVSTLVAAPPGPWLRSSFDGSDQVSPTSSESGFGRVTNETTTAQPTMDYARTRAILEETNTRNATPG